MDEKGDSIGNKLKINLKQEQIQDLLFKKEIGWQEIIYDLINTEQLDPWDINISVLSDKYLEKINELEEADFFLSSQVLLAASLLLRIKSEILLNRYIKSIDEILFGKKEQKKYEMERIELEDEIPELIPRSPIPRFKRVTLQELMESLNKAIITENRRISKEIINKNALRESSISLPKKSFSIKDKINEVFSKILGHLKEEEKHKVSYTELIGEDKTERVISFLPLLQLENNQKIWMHQDGHFEEIYVWLKHIYLKHNPDPFAELREELEKEIKELDEEGKQRLKKINEDFENPLDDLIEDELN